VTQGLDPAQLKYRKKNNNKYGNYPMNVRTWDNYRKLSLNTV